MKRQTLYISKFSLFARDKAIVLEIRRQIRVAFSGRQAPNAKDDFDLDTSTQHPFPKERASGVNLREVLLGCRLPSASEQHRRPSSTEGFPTDPSRRPSEPISTLAFSSLAFCSSSAPGAGPGGGEADASTP